MALGLLLQWSREGRNVEEPWEVTVVEEVVMAGNSGERVVSRPFARWPVDWSAVWVGALSAVVVGLIIALIGVAVGAHRTAATRIVHWNEFGLGTLIFAVCGAFLPFVVGGWVAGRIARFVRAEPAILHGAIAWLLGVSLIVLMAGFGTTPFGPWYRGVVVLRAPAGPAVVEDADAARAARNAALGGVAALLLGLAGASVGGWMASGEPMTLTYHRSRERRVA
jgi:hypothetical protein